MNWTSYQWPSGQRGRIRWQTYWCFYLQYFSNIYSIEHRTVWWIELAVWWFSFILWVLNESEPHRCKFLDFLYCYLWSTVHFDVWRLWFLFSYCKICLNVVHIPITQILSTLDPGLQVFFCLAWIWYANCNWRPFTEIWGKDGAQNISKQLRGAIFLPWRHHHRQAPPHSAGWMRMWSTLRNAQ